MPSGVTVGTLVPKTPVARNCNASGYGRTYTYACATADGTATIGTNSCLRQCTVSGLQGTLTAIVNAGTTSLTCDDTANHFRGTASNGAYSCNGTTGVFLVGTAACGCATGYTKVGSVCQQNCTIPNGTYGITDGTVVNAGTTSINCNATGES